MLDVHDIYYVWYEKSVRRHYWLWLPITVVALLSGFATSIIAALATQESFGQFAVIRVLLVVLPALGAAVSTVAIQSRLYERYHLRENGRRDMQALWNEGRGKFAAAKTPEDYKSVYDELVARLNEIERHQAADFFSLGVAETKAGSQARKSSKTAS